MRSILFICVIFLSAIHTAAAGPGRSEAPTSDALLAITDVTVIPMTDPETILADQTVLIRSNRIAQIGPRDEITLPEDVRIIDGTGRYLLPGLTDMHVHLEYFDDPDILKLFLASGVTMVRNMDGRDYIRSWRDQIAAGDLLGPDIVTAGPILDGNPPVRDDNTVISTAPEGEAAVQAQFEAGYDFIKIYTGLSLDAYRAIISTARETAMPVTGHVPRPVELEQALANQNIEHLSDYADWIEADDSPYKNGWHWSKLYLAMPADPQKMEPAARRVAKSGAWTVPTLMTSERAVVRPGSIEMWRAEPEAEWLPDDAWEIWIQGNDRIAARMDEEDWQIFERGRKNRRALLKAMHDAGARLAAGTDTPNPFLIPGASLHLELQEFVRAGFTPGEAIMAATRNAAEYMGLLEMRGTIEAGKRADLILLDANPLEEIEATKEIAGVVLGGTWMAREDLAVMALEFARGPEAEKRIESQ